MNRLMGFHVDVEKTSRTPSPLPLAKNLPSGENRKVVMESLWPSGRVISREYLGVAIGRTEVGDRVAATSRTHAQRAAASWQPRGSSTCLVIMWPCRGVFCDPIVSRAYPPAPSQMGTYQSPACRSGPRSGRDTLERGPSQEGGPEGTDVWDARSPAAGFDGTCCPRTPLCSHRLRFDART